jgi:hypothetical protein
MISGFGVPDQFDLSDIAFGLSTSVGFVEGSNNLSGTLTVTDGLHTAISRCSVDTPWHTSDGHGVTLVTDPPAAAMTEPNQNRARDAVSHVMLL